MVVEFCDDSARVESVVELLRTLVDPRHILLWPVQIWDNTRC
jgi:hypothetical protein